MKKCKYPRLSYEGIKKVLMGDEEAMTALEAIYALHQSVELWR